MSPYHIADPVNYGDIFTYDLATTVSALSFSDPQKAEALLRVFVEFFGDGREGYFNAYRLRDRNSREIKTTGPIAHLIVGICNYEAQRNPSPGIISLCS